MSKNDTEVQDFTRFRGRLIIQGQLELKTPLRIGAGRGDDLAAADITVVKDALSRPYIPGSSFKGVLRSYTESVLRTIDASLACLCVTTQSDHSCPTTKSSEDLEARLAALKKKDAAALEEPDGPYLDRMYLGETCAICRVFGSPGLAARVQIPDLPLTGEWSNRYQLRYGVSIDRDTETAAAQRLFTSEAVPAGELFNLEVIVESGDPAEQGLVLLGLKSFERGATALGGGSSRGLGRVQLTITDCQEIGGAPASLMDYLVDGQSRPVDATGRQGKINSLRQVLGV